MYGPGKGLGAACPPAWQDVVTGECCNWMDDFGRCIVPSATDRITVSGATYNRLLGSSSGNLSDFVNKNATMIGIAAAAFFGLMIISKR